MLQHFNFKALKKPFENLNLIFLCMVGINYLITSKFGSNVP